MRAPSRRRFLGRAAVAMAAPFGMVIASEAQGRESREWAAMRRATNWINSPPLTAPQLAGKVVLVDFWTYTCINWLRTLPYVRAWAQKYRGRLVVLGVHTPEFPFEHDGSNVRRAIAQMNIPYPVVIDNGYDIWRAFRNNYWPALYFVDARGKVREHHSGEGEYERSERIIQRLIAETGAGATANDLVSPNGSGIEAAPDWANVRSPENYLGIERTQNFASRGGADPNRRRTYSLPTRLALNEWALAGEWTMGQPAARLATPNGRIACRFHARPSSGHGSATAWQQRPLPCVD